MRVVDLAILGLYLVAMLAIGFRMSSRAGTSRGFVAAAKSLPFPAVLASLFGTLLGAGLTLGMAGEAYTAGAGLLAASVGMALIIPVFIWLAPRFRRSGHISIPEMVGARFGEVSRVATSLLIAVYCLLLLGLQFMAFGRLAGYIGAPIGLSPEVGSVIACGVAILYTALAGMFGVAYTDILQSVLMVASVIIVIPLFGMHFAGGVSAVAASAAESGVSIFNPFKGQPIMGFISYAAILFLTMLVEAPVWQRIAAARNIRHLKIGFYGYIPLVIIYGYAVIWAGAAGSILMPHIDQVYGTTEAILPALILEFMPPVVAGLMLAGLIGVIMSTIDSYLLMTSSSITYDIVKYVAPGLSEAGLVRSLKYTTFGLGVLALLASFFFTGIWDMLIFAFTIYPASLAPTVVACFFWKRATGWGVICSIAAGFLTTIAAYSGWLPLSLDPIWPATAASLVVLVAVSYATHQPGGGTPLIGEIEVEPELEEA